MKVSGIICEYNPFHNGHLHHITETRKNGATHIAAVMSGSFVQRGDIAVLDKFTRARLAVKSGADLVIELPVRYSLSSAENFASASVYLLNSLGAVEELSFGSECGDTELLKKAMNAAEKTASEHAAEIREIMEKGYTYPRALYSVLSGIDPASAAVTAEPNNLLAVEYLRALRAQNSKMKPFTIKREGAGHDSPTAEDTTASASYIRRKIAENDIDDLERLMPDIWFGALKNAVETGKTADLSRLERIILYRLRTSSVEEIAALEDVGQGLEHRIYGARMAGSLEELFLSVKTKRYTMARIRRIILSLLIGIKREETAVMPPYGRILALNERGREILSAAKGIAAIPYGSSLAKLSRTSDDAAKFAELESRATDIFGLALGTLTDAGDDFRTKIMIDSE